MGLVDNLLKKFPGTDGLVGTQRYAPGFGLLRGATKASVSRGGYIRETQIPIGIIFYCLHESIGDTDRDIEIGDRVFAGLASDEFFHIRVVHPQDTHIGSAPGTALGNFAKGMVINTQETYRTGGLPGRRFYQCALWPQARKGKTIPAAGLLNQRGVPQGLENTCRVTTHIVSNRKNKTCR